MTINLSSPEKSCLVFDAQMCGWTLAAAGFLLDVQGHISNASRNQGCLPHMVAFAGLRTQGAG